MFKYRTKWFQLFNSREEFQTLFSTQDVVVYRSSFASIIFIKQKSKYYAFKNKCPHQGKPMDNCWVENDSIVCPFHQFQFNLESGRGHGTALIQYKLRIEENGVFIGKEGLSLF
jgi:3-phenylpropionate/trans-cinnamate dioxygenase ferredoxin subunit